MAVSFLAESNARCWRIQISSSAMSGRDCSRRAASRCSGVWLLMRSISKSISIRRTASLAIGASIRLRAELVGERRIRPLVYADADVNFTVAGGSLGGDRIRQDFDVMTARLNYKSGGPILLKY
ncbi:hypothetical protein ABIB80_006672 [Bradyrhizobium sp. i1.15.2]